MRLLAFSFSGHLPLAKWWLPAFASFVLALPLRAELLLVENGKSHAAVVIADAPSPLQRYAAEELVEHVRLATGVTLKTIAEKEAANWPGPRIFVGQGEATREAGITPEGWKIDEYCIRSNDRDLFIVGREGAKADPVPGYMPPYGGTLYGVYEFLEQKLKVRWLWPGDLGRYVPQQKELRVAKSGEIRQAPRLDYRVWWHQDLNLKQWNEMTAIPDIARAVPGLGFSPENTKAYYHDLLVYLIRHRIGNSETPLIAPRVNHTFMGWWAKYGKEHPEWFMMNPDGTRGPRSRDDAGFMEAMHSEEAAMCVSNPDLARFVVEEWWDGGDILSLGEIDYRVFCHCPTCLKWDGEYKQGPDFAAEDYKPLASLRYAKFWKAVRELAVKRNPNVKVGSYLYWNTFPAPQEPIDLSGGIMGEFTPWSDSNSFYPVKPEVDEWMKQQWVGWNQTGMEMIYRPNYFHAGHVMPHISTRQAGEFFRFAYKNGMKGFFFDSLHGHWATQGPMIYVIMELMWNPEREVEEIRQDYFAAFGPAAKSIEAYFDYWEAYAERWPGETKGYDGRSLLLPHTFLKIAYGPEVFPTAFEFLKKARKEAAGSANEEYAKRVAFLQAGLEHAQLTAKLYQSLQSNGRSVPTDPEGFLKAKTALEALATFRRKHEALYLADFNQAAQREGWTIEYQPLLRSEP